MPLELQTATAGRPRVQRIFRPASTDSDRVQTGRASIVHMGDFLSVLAMAVFVVVMLALVKGLERV
jgi:hypothetical protein